MVCIVSCRLTVNKLPPDPNADEVPSTVVGEVGLVIAFACLFILPFFVSFAGVLHESEHEWGLLELWALFGSNAVMGMSLMGGGKFMSRPVRATFLIATVISLLVGLLTFIDPWPSVDNYDKGLLFFWLPFAALTSLTPQLTGWRR